LKPQGRLIVHTAPNLWYARYFKSQLGEQSIYYGPKGGNLHAPDEYVELDSVLEAARVLSRLVIRWCG
ncbi:MAG: M20/M25/M40 family metallo-hydrolase, partial [Candidatus Aminicenantes bacterium]|nr:M20/M25/M40 family metallo-hydrolase [Candidatus Aminicenantes bacterium]